MIFEPNVPNTIPLEQLLQCSRTFTFLLDTFTEHIKAASLLTIHPVHHYTNNAKRSPGNVNTTFTSSLHVFM